MTTEPTGADSERTTDGGPGARRLDLDNLRNLVVLSLIPFHTARLYDAESWHLKARSSYAAADVLIRFMNLWQMPSLFLLAGIAMALALEKRSAGEFARERLLRLGVPLVFGILVVVPPQVYIERISHAVANRQSPVNFDGSLFEFMGSYLSCCYPQGNLSYHHLWFIFYLLVFSLVALPLVRVRRLRITPTGGHARLLLFGPGIVLVCIELALRRTFPSTHDLVNDWANNAHYFWLLLVGALAISDPRALSVIARARRIALIAALALTAAWFWVSYAPMESGVVRFVIRTVLRGAAEWSWLLAMLGTAHVAFNRRISYVTAFTRYAYPFYIFHQTVIVVTAFFVFRGGMPALADYALIAVIATVISLALARLFDLSAPSRMMIGLASPKRSPPAA